MKQTKQEDKMADNVFNEIANELVTVLPKGWEIVHLYSYIAKGTYEFFYYVKIDGKYIQCFDLSEKYGIQEDSILSVFDKLYSLLKEEQSKSKWNVCTFSLTSEGKFNMDYDYEPFPEDEFAYKNAWEKKYLK